MASKRTEWAAYCGWRATNRRRRARRGGVLAFVEVKARADLETAGDCARRPPVRPRRARPPACSWRAIRTMPRIRCASTPCWWPGFGRGICRMSGARRSMLVRARCELTSRELGRLRDLCAGDGERRLDLLEAALTLSVLQRDEPIDLAPFRQHVAAMASDLADLVHRRGALARAAGRGDRRGPTAIAATARPTTTCRTPTSCACIERRKGLPVALSILYLHVARAQGWDAEGLAFPGHFLIRVGIDGARHVRRSLQRRPGARCRRAARAAAAQVLGPDAELQPQHFDPVSDRDVLLRLENNVRLRLAKREDWAGAAQSLDRMLAIAPDRPELLFEAGQTQCAARQAPRRDRRLRALSRHRGRHRPIPSCASARPPCCRNCVAGLTDYLPVRGVRILR